MKLVDYMKANGLRPMWVAEKIGMKSSNFSSAIHGKVKVPVRYWKNIVELTKGQVTLEDLYEDYFG